MTKEIIGLTITQALNAHDGGEIWVINTTEGENRGPVHLTIDNGGGQMTPVFIPDTWLPLDLLSFAPLSALRDSSFLRAALNSGAIKLVSEDYAQELRSREGASEEMARIRQNLGNVNAENLRSAKERQQNQETDSNVSPRITSLISRLNEGDISEVNLINTLRTISSSLTDEDVDALGRAAKNGNNKKLLKFMRDIRDAREA